MSAVADGIASQTRRGALWQLGGKACGFALTFGGGIALARLLEPDDFGLWALALFCMKFARQATSAGLLQSIVQKEGLDRQTRDTAFWMGLVTGIVLWGAIYALAPGIGRIWANDRLAGCVRTLAVVIPLAALQTVPQAVIQREMRFAALTAIGLAASGAELLCGIILAVSHFGVYSLVLGTVCGGIVSTAATGAAARYWPGPPRFTGGAGLLRFAAPVTASYLVRLVASDADYLIIGQRLSAASVGLYRRAYSSTTTAVATIVFPLQDVLFPAFSRLQAQDDRLRSAYSRSLAGLGTAILPIATLLFVVAPEFIPLVYGSRWQASVAPTRVLCLPMVFMVLAEPSSSLLKGVGRAGTEAACQALYMSMLCTGAWVGARWDISGVAMGVAIAVVVNGCACCVLASRAIALPAPALWKAVRAPVAGASLGVAAASLTRHAMLSHNVGLWYVMGATAIVGAVTYCAALLYLPFPEAREVLRVMLTEFRQRRSGRFDRRG